MSSTPTRRPLRDLTLTGQLVPWNSGGPVLLNFTGSDFLYLPCFSTEAHLRELLALIREPVVDIKHIDDQASFLSTVLRRNKGRFVKVISVTELFPDGRMRFMELLWD